MDIDEHTESSDKLIASPCVRNCCLDDTDICIGCLRSLTEITSWSELGNKQREQILTNIDSRRAGEK